MSSTVSPVEIVSLPAAKAWDAKTDHYLASWPVMNRPLERKAFEFLPTLPVEAIIHVAGVGGGQEILPLVRLYPGNMIIASDVAENMVRRTQFMLDRHPRRFPVHPVQADIHTPPVWGVDAAISLFTVHLVRHPVEAIRAQWESLAPGGMLAALYFPPLPLGEEGPLVSLYKAMRKLVDKPPSSWEDRALSLLHESGAEKVARREIMARWQYKSLEQVMPVFEALPHIAGIRKRMGDEAYEALWRHFHDDPGVYMEGDSLFGAVGAVLLTAIKPGTSVEE